MRVTLLVIVCLFAMCSRSGAQTAGVDAWFDGNFQRLAEAYYWFHQNPEVSFEEEKTAEKLAEYWERFGFKVTRKVGGFGIVGLMENGAGTTLMLRCDLDALPLTEQTQLPYASTATYELPGGATTGVMHACGHDVHMTNLLAVAKYLSEHRDQWSGTLMLVGQPAEERGAGARAMLEDGLFEKFPKPDFAIALHTSSDTPSGTVKLMPGYALANVNSVDITVKGRGGHGSAPHTTIDPIVQAAELVCSLQTIVSRETRPLDPAVVTVGSIKGGTKHNIIPDECKLQLTVRSYTDDVRDDLLAAIKRKAEAIAASYDAPEPIVKFSEGTPSLRNDAKLADRMRAAFEKAIGKENVSDDEPSMGGEDFSRYGRAGVPILMYRLGTVNQQRLDRFEALGVPPPSLHSSKFYPDLEPSLKTGVKTMTAAALELLAPSSSSKH